MNPLRTKKCCKQTFDYFGRISFFCAMIAAITLRFLDPFRTGKLVLFQVTYDKVASKISLSKNVLNHS